MKNEILDMLPVQSKQDIRKARQACALFFICYAAVLAWGVYWISRA